MTWSHFWHSKCIIQSADSSLQQKGYGSVRRTATSNNNSYLSTNNMAWFEAVHKLVLYIITLGFTEVLSLGCWFLLPEEYLAEIAAGRVGSRLRVLTHAISSIFPTLHFNCHLSLPSIFYVTGFPWPNTVLDPLASNLVRDQARKSF